MVMKFNHVFEITGCFQSRVPVLRTDLHKTLNLRTNLKLEYYIKSLNYI